VLDIKPQNPVRIAGIVEARAGMGQVKNVAKYARFL
jgi:hypothetical protein